MTAFVSGVSSNISSSTSSSFPYSRVSTGRIGLGMVAGSTVSMSSSIPSSKLSLSESSIYLGLRTSFLIIALGAFAPKDFL